MRPVLAGMLEHGWIEAELETGHPENRQIMETYAIEGWPFFVLIGPDGTILARNYTNAFYQAKKILDKELAERPPNEPRNGRRRCGRRKPRKTGPEHPVINTMFDL